MTFSIGNLRSLLSGNNGAGGGGGGASNISNTSGLGIPAMTTTLYNGTGMAGSIFSGSPGPTGITGPIGTQPSYGISQPDMYSVAYIMNDYACGRDFYGPGQMWVTDFCVFENYFHWLVWKLLHEDTATDYGTIHVRDMNPRLNQIAAFRSQKSFEQFNEWITAYKARFSVPINTVRLPPLPQGRIEGESIARPYRAEPTDLSPKDVEQWAWIVANCPGQAWFTPEHVIFERTTDAVHYKLRWGGV